MRDGEMGYIEWMITEEILLSCWRNILTHLCNISDLVVVTYLLHIYGHYHFMLEKYFNTFV